MNRDALRRLEVVARGLTPEELPARHFFAIQRFQAEAGYGNQTPAEVLERVTEVDRVISEFDMIRIDHGLDPIDFAIVVNRGAFPGHNQSAGAIAGLLVGAFWNQDRDRHGEHFAWSHQRDRTHLESIVAGRLATLEAA